MSLWAQKELRRSCHTGFHLQSAQWVLGREQTGPGRHQNLDDPLDFFHFPTTSHNLQSLTLPTLLQRFQKPFIPAFQHSSNRYLDSTIIRSFRLSSHPPQSLPRSCSRRALAARASPSTAGLFEPSPSGQTHQSYCVWHQSQRLSIKEVSSESSTTPASRQSPSIQA